MSGYGVPHTDIALVLEIAPKSLRKHFDRELKLGKAKANAKIGQTLYQQAVGGNTVAAIYWTKSQMGWRETIKIESENTGKPSQTVALLTVDPVEAAKTYQKLIAGR